MTTMQIRPKDNVPLGARATETTIDLDDEALAAAAEIYGTSTVVETVNTALREAAARLRRARALAEMVEIAKTGQFDELLAK
jgi:Arc/MetJ family transcription regulator